MDYKYNAIILSKMDVGETDRIYTAYTQEAGKISLIAKGVKKSDAKLAGNLEPVNYVEIFVAKSKGKGKITGVIGADNFSHIKEKIAALEKVFYVFQLFDRLVTQEEKDEKIFHLLLVYLGSLDKISLEEEADPKADILTFGFVFKLLQGLGYEFQMKKCAACAKMLQSGKNFFSAKRGGVLCEDCSISEGKKIKISDETIKLIRIFLENKLENFGKIRMDKLNIGNLKLITSLATGWLI
jgi:DNA repair protein RecO (recombination protein O)